AVADHAAAAAVARRAPMPTLLLSLPNRGNRGFPCSRARPLHSFSYGDLVPFSRSEKPAMLRRCCTLIGSFVLGALVVINPIAADAPASKGTKAKSRTFQFTYAATVTGLTPGATA